MTTTKIHVCVGFYLNGDYVVNHVRDEDLEANIKYNKTYRPGRFYFADGEYVCGGLLVPEAQSKFIKKCKDRLMQMALEPAKVPSYPYN